MHPLARLEQAFQELGPKFIKFLLHLVTHEFKDFFDLLDEDDLFCGARDRPVLEETLDQRHIQL